MLDRTLRPHKSRALAPVAAALAPVPPLAITAVGLTIGLVGVGFAASGWWLPALGAWWLNRLADGLDGEVARRAGTATDRGGYLDLLADTVIYGSLPLGVAAGIGSSAAWMAAAALLASFYVNVVSLTFLAAVLEKRSAGAAARGEPTTTTLPSGLVEGTETVVFFSLLLLTPGLAIPLMGLMTAAVAATAIGRAARAWPLLDDPVGATTTEPRTTSTETQTQTRLGGDR